MSIPGQPGSSHLGQGWRYGGAVVLWCWFTGQEQGMLLGSSASLATAEENASEGCPT